MTEDMVKIKTPKGEDRVTYHRLEMEDGRGGGQPTKVWIFLKILAKNQGFISSKTKYDPTIPDTAKRFNKHMKTLFGINESVFKGHYKKEKGYKTKIMFSDQTTVVD